MYLNGFLPVVCAVALPISVTTNHNAAARFWPTLPLLTGSYGSFFDSRDVQKTTKSCRSPEINFERPNAWNEPLVAAKQSLLTGLSTRRTLTYPKKIFKRRLIERQWLIVRIE